MNNIKIGPNGVTALRSASFAEAGLTALNTSIVYRVNPSANWVPGRTVNGLTSIVEGESYYLVSKVARDLTQFFSPPLLGDMQAYTFESFGILSTNTDAQNKVALQAAIDQLTQPTEKTKVLFGSGVYPIRGPIDIKKDVQILGNSTGLKGSPNTATFKITDNTANVFRMQSRTSLNGWNWDYPNNNNLTTPQNVITYPTAVVNFPGYVQQIRIENHNFCGGTKFVEFIGAEFCADLHFHNWYGYPLGGTMFNISHCFDIPYVDLIHVNPGTGRDYRAVAPNGLPFSNAMIDYVCLTGAPTFRVNVTDEFVFSRLFSFGTKTGLQVQESYGSVTQANFDMVETAFDIKVHADNSNETRKAVVLNACSCIPSAGVVGNKYAVKFSGYAGILNIQGLNIQLGTNPVVPSSSTPNANAAILVNGTGPQRLIMSAVTSFGLQNFAFDVKKDNAAAQIISTASNINNANTKIVNASFFEG